MYIKLIFKNAKRSARDYLVYIVTLTICATLFYSFLSVSSRYYKPDIGSDYKFTLLGDSMKLAICTVTLILLFLIWFVNNYMLRCRQKNLPFRQFWEWRPKRLEGFSLPRHLSWEYALSGWALSSVWSAHSLLLQCCSPPMEKATSRHGHSFQTPYCSPCSFLS